MSTHTPPGVTDPRDATVQQPSARGADHSTAAGLGEKAAVKAFWEDASCGERLYLTAADLEGFQRQAATRYELEPYILDFAQFPATRGKKVLEIGVGLGADHQRFAENGATLWGIDLTQKAVGHTRRRMAAFGLTSQLQVADAENLPFPDDAFDVVYSWGVLHHSPDTPRAIAEVRRVLKPGGQARIMVYHRHSFVGYMLWLRYGLGRLKPRTTLDQIYAEHLESPGTKAYSVAQGYALMSAYRRVRIETVLTHGDLLSSSAGQRHGGRVLDIARRVWPRATIQRFFPQNGLFMLISAEK